MNAQQRIDYTNKQVREQLAKGRGRLVIVKLAPSTKKLIERKP